MEAIVTTNQQKSITRRLWFVLIAGLALAVVALSTRNATALTLSPPSLEYSVEPGDTISSKIKLYNNTAEAQKLFTSTANFGAKGEGGEPDFNFDAPTADLSAWIKPDQAVIDLLAGETAEATFTINVPADAEPGGHYAGLFFGTGSPAGLDSSQVQLQSKLGALVLVRVSGNIREEATIDEFGVATKTLNRLPVELFLRVENSGNIHVRPSGTVTVRNMFGGVSSTIQVNPKDGAVLPNSVRRFDLAWQKKDVDPDRGGFFSELQAEWRNFALGTYTADVAVTYGEAKKVTSASVQFTIFPWRAIAVFVLGLVLVILVIVFGMKRYNAMIIGKAQAGMAGNSGSTPAGKK